MSVVVREVSCAPSSLIVDNRHLPVEWLRDVHLPVSGVAPKQISLSVQIDERRVFAANATTGFHMWTKRSRCPDCKLGSGLVAVDRQGHFSGWDGES